MECGEIKLNVRNLEPETNEVFNTTVGVIIGKDIVPPPFWKT